MAKSRSDGRKVKKPTPPKIGAAKWKALYEAAAEFHALDAWERLYETDFFGLRDPADGALYLGQVLGGMGEYFALHLYGGEGGHAYCASALDDYSEPDSFVAQYCVDLLIVEFTTRGWMEAHDMKVRKALGALPKMTGGAPGYLRFRSQKPGFAPWFPTAAEAELMRIGLRRAIDFVRRFDGDPDLMDDGEGGQVLHVFQCREGADPTVAESWNMVVEDFPGFDDEFTDEELEEEFAAPATEEEEAWAAEILAEGLDEVAEARLAKLGQREESRWEIGGSYLPAPVMEGERPFYPYVTLIVDSASGRVVDQAIASPNDDRPRLVRQLFVSAAERSGALPSAVAIDNVGDVLALAGIVGRCGIAADAEGSTNALADCLDAMVAAYELGEL